MVVNEILWILFTFSYFISGNINFKGLFSSAPQNMGQMHIGSTPRQ